MKKIIKSKATGELSTPIVKNGLKNSSLIEEYAELQAVNIVSNEIDINPGPVYRYSDEELNEFRTLINVRLDIARKELIYLQGQMRGKDSSGIEDNSDWKLSLEDGSGAMEREQLSQLTSRQIQFIQNLERALIRISNKTYGICRQSGKLIDKARLRAVPHATLSMDAKNAKLKG